MLRNSHSPTPDESRINSTLSEYNVQSEEEFVLFIDDNWDKMNCLCGSNFSLLHCRFSHNGNVICPSCGREVG